MSAFIASDLTTVAVATTVLGPAATVQSVQAIADVLRAENLRSINHRYNESNPAERVITTPSQLAEVRALSPDRLLGAVLCFMYQSCETADWKSTAAFALTSAVEASLVATGATREGGDL